MPLQKYIRLNYFFESGQPTDKPRQTKLYERDQVARFEVPSEMTFLLYRNTCPG